MELWIRIQDKDALRKINTGLYLREDLSDYAEGNVWFIVSSGDKLGEYKTKERALEVLDEIQNFMLCNREYGYTSNGYINELAKCYIYEMPKE